MAKLTTNHVLFWFGTGASIPGGFARHNIGTTARFLSSTPASGGTVADPGSTGGALTHTHGLPDHSHVGSSHSHTYSSNEITHDTDGSHPAAGGGSNARAKSKHSHSGGTVVSTAVNTDARTGMVCDASTSGATTPPFVEALLIKPSADGADVPTSATVFFESATPPTGFVAQDGTGTGTPDLTAKFIRIAANATSDGGATGGTTATHTHSQTHYHTIPTHSHSGNSIDPSVSSSSTGQLGTTEAFKGHAGAGNHHSISWTTDNTGDVNPTTNNLGNSAAGIEPPLIKLAPMKNTGAASMPSGIIVPYIGTVAQLAALSDWQLCDGTNGTPNLHTAIGSDGERAGQIQCAFTALLAKYGKAAHQHNAWPSHTHTLAASHTHTVSNDIALTDFRITTSATDALCRSALAHTHNNEHVWTMAATTPTLVQNSSDLDSTSVDHLDPWLEVLWAKYSPTVLTVIIPGGIIAGGVIP